MTTTNAAVSGKGRRWPIWLAAILGVLLLLVVVLYFVATSAAFLKGFILPKASKAMNAQITVTDATIKPFSMVVLKGLKVQTTGSEPLLTAQEVRLRYSLSDILGGNMKVDEVYLGAPVINYIVNPDGKTSNLDPIMQGSGEEKKADQTTGKGSSEPMKVDLRELRITDGLVRQIQLHEGGTRDVTELSGLNAALTGIKNGQTGKLEVQSNVSLDQNPPAPGTKGSLQALLAGNFNLALTPDLKPDAITGKSTVDVQKGGGSMESLAGSSLALECDVTPHQVRNVVLGFLKGAQRLGEVRVTGPFELDKNEGQLDVRLSGIDKQALNLAGAAFGMDFGSTTLSSTNSVALSQGGKVISVAGRFSANSFSVTRTNQTTPPMDLGADYNLTVDQAAQSALLRQLTIDGVQKQRPVIRGELTQPMTISWGGTTQNVPDSDFSLVVTNFDLADWKAFVGTMAPAGIISSTLKLTSRESGKLLNFDFKALAANLTVIAGSNQVTQLRGAMGAQGQAREMKQVDLAGYDAELARNGKAIFSAKGAGKYNLETEAADLRTTLSASLPQLVELAPMPELKVTSGALSGETRVVQDKGAQTVSGAFQLGDFTGAWTTNKFDKLGATLELDLTKQKDLVQIRKANGVLRHGTAEAGTFETSGTTSLDTNASAADLRIAGKLNLPELLRAAPQAGMEVASGVVTLQTQVAQKLGSQAVSGAMKVAGFTGKYGDYAFTNLDKTMEFDVAMKDQKADIRKLAGALTVGGQPGGRFEMTGSVHLTNNSGQIQFKLADLNQRLLGPVLASSLGEKQLISASLDANASAQYDLARESTIKAEARLANLRVKDPAQPNLTNALEMNLQLDAAMRQKLLEFRRAVLALSPTSRASNSVELKGRIDMTVSNAIEGALTLTSSGLDVTPYYDMFMSAPATNATAAATTPTTGTTTSGAGSPQAPAEPEKEPDPIPMPIKKFVVDASLGHLFLREVDMANVKTVVAMDASNVVIKPLQCVLNGAPVEGSMAFNIGVPGWKYDVAVKSGAIPLEPLANSFAPEYAGRASGQILMDVAIQGAGITGPSLKKNLTGHFYYSLTNASVQIASPSVRKWLVPVATFLKMPELTEAPVTSMGTMVDIGSGKIDIKDTRVTTGAFIGTTAGQIEMASVLTNSVIKDLPITLAIRRDLMNRIGLVPKDTPADVAFIPMPTPIIYAGTIGMPELNKKKMAVSSLAGLANIPGLKGTDAGKIMQGFGTLLGGGSKTNTAAGGTNAPSSPLGGVLGGLLGGNKSTATTTNAPATNAPSSSLGGVLDGLLGGNKSAATATNAPATNAPAKPTTQQLIQGIFGGAGATTNAPGSTNAPTVNTNAVNTNTLAPIFDLFRKKK